MLSGLTGYGQTDRDIHFPYGHQQQFRYRHQDINILGHMDETLNVTRAGYRLNGGKEVSFYVKGADSLKDKISRNRLDRDGMFNIEIPVNSPSPQKGANQVEVIIYPGDGEPLTDRVSFDWNPVPVNLPVELTDLTDVTDIQSVAQVVDGEWKIDQEANVIRTRTPVHSDALLLIGSPHRSQEATYGVRFAALKGVFLGLSDFFAGHEAADPPIGIKPGWSSAGLATMRPDPERAAQVWLAWGDLLESPKKWVVKTDPPIPFPVQAGVTYRIRHQVLFANGVNRARFRIWEAGTTELAEWLCSKNDVGIPDTKQRFTRGSFGLFQYAGEPSEWFDIRVEPLSEMRWENM